MLKGFSIGMILVGALVYICESLCSKGFVLSVVNACAALGGLISSAVANVLNHRMPDKTPFKYAWAGQNLWMVLFFLFSFFLPQSPRWLALQGKWPSASKTLERLQRKSISNPTIPATLAGATQRCSFTTLFSQSMSKFTSTAVLSPLLIQISCLNCLISFFPEICRRCAVDEEVIFAFELAQSAIIALFSGVPMLILDRCRRKDSMIFGTVILSAIYTSIFVLAHIYGTWHDQDSLFHRNFTGISASAVLALFLFSGAIYTSTVLVTAILHSIEVFPYHARAKGASLAMTVSWTVNASANLGAPYFVEHLNEYIFVLMAILCFVSALIILSFPETRFDIHLQPLTTSTDAFGKSSSFLPQITPSSLGASEVNKSSSQSDKSQRSAKDEKRASKISFHYPPGLNYTSEFTGSKASESYENTIEEVENSDYTENKTPGEENSTSSQDNHEEEFQNFVPLFEPTPESCSSPKESKVVSSSSSDSIQHETQLQTAKSHLTKKISKKKRSPRGRSLTDRASIQRRFKANALSTRPSRKNRDISSCESNQSSETEVVSCSTNLDTVNFKTSRADPPTTHTEVQPRSSTLAPIGASLSGIWTPQFESLHHTVHGKRAQNETPSTIPQSPAVWQMDVNQQDNNWAHNRSKNILLNANPVGSDDESRNISRA